MVAAARPTIMAAMTVHMPRALRIGLGGSRSTTTVGVSSTSTVAGGVPGVGAGSGTVAPKAFAALASC